MVARPPAPTLPSTDHPPTGAPGASARPAHGDSRVTPRIPTSFPFRLGLWLALATAIFELAVRLVIWQVTPRPLEAGIHLVWMAPAMNLIWFMLAATVAYAAMRLWPSRMGLAAVVGFMTFPAFLSVLWLHPMFHRTAMVVLALGLAIQAGRLAGPRLASVLTVNRRAAWITVPIMSLAIAVVLGTDRWREWSAMRALPDARAGAPNVLLLVLDTVRSFSLSVYGYADATTPTLEQLARESVRFDRAFATSGWTLPSHGSLFTGRYADELRTGPGRPLPPGPTTLAEALSAAGYATGGFVANLKYTTWEHGVARGFAHYEDHPATPLTLLTSTALGRKVFAARRVRERVGYVDDVDRKSADRVQASFLAWLDRIGDRPFFAFLNYYDAHHPYLPPAPYDTAFGPSLPLRYRPYPPVFRQFDSAEIALAANGYHGAIAYVDDRVGRLIEALRRRGQLDNTLIIITSDHGEHLGDHRLMSHGNSFYRQLLQVPLLMRHPARLPGNGVVRRPVSLRDVAATVLDVAALENDGRIPGASLMAVIGDSSAPVSAIVSGSALVRGTEGQSLISDGVHYIRMADGREELYDLETDSLETRSLVETPEGAALLAGLRSRLDSINTAHPPPPR